MAVQIKFNRPSGDIIVAAKIVDVSEDLDACLLSFEQAFECEYIPLGSRPPRAGSEWRSYGFPLGKTDMGHRITGLIAQVLNPPRQLIDLDLSVDPMTSVVNYRGCSGAMTVVEGVNVGMLRFKLGGGLGALSCATLNPFLRKNGIECAANPAGAGRSGPPLADRNAFQKAFEDHVRKAGGYLFLEGGHGLGKTTFCENYQPVAPDIVAVGAHCLALPQSPQSATYRAQPEVVFDWLQSVIAALITGEAPRIENQPYAKLVLLAEASLKRLSDFAAAKQRHAVLFVDGLNEALATDPSTLTRLLGLFPLTLPKNVTVVLTAPNYSLVQGYLGGRVNAQNVWALPPLSDAASAKYCRNRLKPSNATSGMISRICGKALGHPLYLRYIIEYANQRSPDDTLDEFPVLAGPIEQYYDTVWARLLPEANAINLLAIFARLRWGIALSELARALTAAEQSSLVSTVTQIRHLLEEPDGTAIYHHSFSLFVVSKTGPVHEVLHDRLAEFCRTLPVTAYGQFNAVYHLARGSPPSRSQSLSVCGQVWMDDLTASGVDPDLLLEDIDSVLAVAMEMAPVADFFRLLLLSQRADFRYNSLFAGAAALMAEALIALGRPNEAVNHVLRFKSLIVPPDSALRIAYQLGQADAAEDALKVLSRLFSRLSEAMSERMKLDEFVRLCALQIELIFQARLAGGPNGMDRVIEVSDYARRACADTFPDHPDVIPQMMLPVTCRSTVYFLAFRDHYADLAELKRRYPGAQVPPQYLEMLCVAVMEFERTIDIYDLGKRRTVLPQLLADMATIAPNCTTLSPDVAWGAADTLIRLGAESPLIELLANKAGGRHPPAIALTDESGVDVDLGQLAAAHSGWRVAAYVDRGLVAPALVAFGSKSWLEALKAVTATLAWCEGRSRRAKADRNEAAVRECWKQLQDMVVEPLSIRLNDRAHWENAYAIPEHVVPFLHRHLIEIIADCFPEQLESHLDRLQSRSGDQCGLYTEGFRRLCHRILKQLLREECTPGVRGMAVTLLHAWREHVVRGVENRYELVPELLVLIPLHRKLGLQVEAGALYRQMLAVSMGPNWYKESQLGLMVTTLAAIPKEDEVAAELATVAGYLDRADGEMTFQRYVRAEKATLAGEFFRRDLVSFGIAYFQRQSCGTLAELRAEMHAGAVDRIAPDLGMRFPGGALEEQATILQMVRNLSDADWRLRWSLLEIFHCGDERHIDDYAEGFAGLANLAVEEPALLADLKRRAEIVARAETWAGHQEKFASHFYETLVPPLHSEFSASIPRPAKPATTAEAEAPEEKELTEADEKFEAGMLLPGTFGRLAAFREIKAGLKTAEVEWAKGNRTKARAEAGAAIAALQAAGWNIWDDNLGEDARMAERFLDGDESNPAAIIRRYAPFVRAEKHTAKWCVASHLVGKVMPLLEPADRRRVLHEVLDHVRLMIGDASTEVGQYAQYAGSVKTQSNIALFEFIAGLCDHQMGQRRERAASMLAWLSEGDSMYLAHVARLAFRKESTNSADVLAGIVDCRSRRAPGPLWQAIASHIAIDEIVQQMLHLSRLEVLRRIASAAANIHASAEQVAARVDELLAGRQLGAVGEACQIPSWGSVLELEWAELTRLGVAGAGLLAAWNQALESICGPWGIPAVWNLEKQVAANFRDAPRRSFQRWETKLRAALNHALFSIVPRAKVSDVERILRIYNPSQPELLLQAGENPAATRLLAAIRANQYAGVFIADGIVTLNLHSMIVDGDDKLCEVEATAVVVPSNLRRRGFFVPKLTATFASNELPPQLSGEMYEVACTLEPRMTFFGVFTPAVPLRAFMLLSGAKESDFHRETWRWARSNRFRKFGVPTQEGARLAIARKQLKLPSDRKLAWIVWLDRKFITLVDDQDYRLH